MYLYQRFLFLCCLAAWGQMACAQVPIYQNPVYTLEQRLTHLLDSMSVTQKLAQLQMIGKNYYPHLLKNDTAFYSYGMVKRFPEGVGGVFIDPRQGSIKHALVRQHLQQHATARSLRVPALFFEHLFSPADTLLVGLPTPLALAATWQPETVQQYARHLGHYKRQQGVHALVGPIAAPLHDPRLPEFAESFGEVPLLSAQLTAAWVKGVQGNLGTEGVGAILRLSPRRHTALAPAVLSRTAFLQTLLPVLRAAAQTDCWALAAGTGYLEQRPMHFDAWAWQEITRKKAEYKGLLLPTKGEVSFVTNLRVYNPEQNPLLPALRAGIDLELPEMEHEATWQAANLSLTRLSAKQLDERLAKVLALKFKLGLFEEDYRDSAALRIPWAALQKVRKAAAHVVSNSFVLLKNHEKGLPLRPEVKKIALVDAAHLETLPAHWGIAQDSLVGLHKAMERAKLTGQSITYAEGVPFRRAGEEKTQEMQRKKLLQEALQAAQQADVVILTLGETKALAASLSDSTTAQAVSFQQTNLQLPRNQHILLEQLLDIGKPVVVVLVGAYPYTLQEAFGRVSAVLHTWEPTAHTSEVLAKMLYGTQQPNGFLPFNYPKSAGHLSALNHSALTQEIEENMYLFPVGHGLSYTTVVYDTITVKKDEITASETLEASLQLRNTGKQASEQLVCWFLSKEQEWVGHTPKLLKHFERIPLKVGETRTVRLTLTPDALGALLPDGTTQAAEGTYRLFCYAPDGKKVVARFEVAPTLRDQRAPTLQEATTNH